MQLRAVATDVDRTLTDDALVLDLDAIRTVRLLEGAGIPVVLCSGRDVIALGALAHYLGTSGVIVAEDGAILGRFGPAHYSTRLLAKPERVHEALAALEEAFGVDVQVVPVPSRLASFVLTRALDAAAANHLCAGPSTCSARTCPACPGRSRWPLPKQPPKPPRPKPASRNGRLHPGDAHRCPGPARLRAGELGAAGRGIASYRSRWMSTPSAK